MQLHNYRDVMKASQRINWKLEDVIGGDKKLDFDRPFLPESLAQVSSLGFLTAEESLALNQIRAHAYLCIFGLVEEFILPFLLDHARTRLLDDRLPEDDDYEVQALLQFAGEEAKHIQLFKVFREEFVSGFGSRCDVIGPVEEIVRTVLSHHPLGVALATLHIEWMTQRHYVESVRDNHALDPQFRSLLKHHWQEESQHTKIDTMIVEALARSYSPGEIEQAVDEYLEIGVFLDGGLAIQVHLDLDALERKTRRKLTVEEREQAFAVQLRANRATYLGSGMTHPSFVSTLLAICPRGADRVAQIAPAFC